MAMEPLICKREMIDDDEALSPVDSKRGLLFDGSSGGGAECSVCGASANGIHYNSIACRSCVAFFRRTITYKQARFLFSFVHNL